MGVKSGYQMLYTLNKVSFSDLCTILRHRASERSVANTPDSNECTIPTVYFDVSWLQRKMCTKTSNGSCQDILSLALQFVKEGIKVVLACDNRNHRHHSKKATIQRDQQCEQYRIDVICLKKKLLELVTTDGQTDGNNSSTQNSQRKEWLPF